MLRQVNDTRFVARTRLDLGVTRRNLKGCVGDSESNVT